MRIKSNGNTNTAKAIQIKAHPSSGDTFIGDINCLTTAPINTSTKYVKTDTNTWTLLT